MIEVATLLDAVVLAVRKLCAIECGLPCDICDPLRADLAAKRSAIEAHVEGMREEMERLRDYLNDE